jgi:gamma-glutamylcyclotransferase (GGCT)/AIG2-like uncharacterized protein YtfP
MKDYPKYYFAYGSNVMSEQMARRCPSATFEQAGYLDGAKLCFRGYSGGWGGAVATLSRGSGRDVVPGVLYSMTTKDWKLLDAFEGYPWQYTAINRLVRLQNGAVVRARTYILADHTKLVAEPATVYTQQIERGLASRGLCFDHVSDAAIESHYALKARVNEVGQFQLEFEKDQRFSRKGVRNNVWRASTGRAIFAKGR